ncbi:alpha tubulin, putative [Babesia ovis]|uniref:Alpha tubulin, putative n=1 Tax=Babesia ovis TaxID=5869 RepID=A0A9W5TAT7_BABOV|nr:alpha tubulin, putative [Babesia ovis]
MMAQDFKKISLAIIELPQEEACMGTPVEMIMQRISISPPAPEQMQESGNDPVHISDILNKEMEVPLSTSTKVQDEPTISNTENQNNASEIHIMMPKLIYRGKRIIKKTKRKASDKKNKTKVETPIPTRNYGTRCCINRETNTPSPQSIVKHLKRATQLLMKRKKQTCEYIRREFDELRHTIETRFHLVLCRRQERWNRINMTYVKRLDDITNGVEEDFKIPRLNELVKRLPEPIRLQPIPEIDLCMSTIQTTMCDQNGNMAMK